MAMDWNPADEFSGRDPRICEECDGTGERPFGLWVSSPWPGYMSDEAEPCKACKGTGRVEPHLWLTVEPTNRAHQDRIPDDDVPF